MRRYRVDAPCPELGVVMARVVAEVKPGEEAVVVTKWRYVVKDIQSAAEQLGLEVISVREGPEIEVVIRKR